MQFFWLIAIRIWQHLHGIYHVWATNSSFDAYPPGIHRWHFPCCALHATRSAASHMAVLEEGHDDWAKATARYNVIRVSLQLYTPDLWEVSLGSFHS